jgi:hypothetical protein
MFLSSISSARRVSKTARSASGRAAASFRVRRSSAGPVRSRGRPGRARREGFGDPGEFGSSRHLRRVGITPRT